MALPAVIAANLVPVGALPPLLGSPGAPPGGAAPASVPAGARGRQPVRDAHDRVRHRCRGRFFPGGAPAGIPAADLRDQGPARPGPLRHGAVAEGHPGAAGPLHRPAPRLHPLATAPALYVLRPAGGPPAPGGPEGALGREGDAALTSRPWGAR